MLHASNPTQETPVPLYEYACKSCRDHVEVRQSFSDAPLTVCASCGGALQRVLQPVGIVFKGSGWYITDSRPKSSESGSSSSTSSSSSSSSKSDSKTTTATA